MSWGDENTEFQVVANHEEQYSIWPDYKAIPAGWRAVGKSEIVLEPLITLITVR